MQMQRLPSLTTRRVVDFSIVCVLLLVLSTAFGVLPRQICELDKISHEEHCEWHSIGYSLVRTVFVFLDNWNAIIVALSTVAVAAFTYTLKRSTDKLWDAGERQLQHARESSERQLRAYVVVEKFALRDVLDEHAPRASVTLKNSGQTPAKNLRTYCKVYRVTRKHSGDFPFLQVTEGSKCVVGPGQKIRIGDVYEEAPHFAFDMAASKYVVNGRIEYTDVFGVDRWTEFRFEHVFEFGNTNGHAGVRWTNKGNDFY